jgi:transcriptional regulator with XRE-family HTH domain
MAIDSWRVCYGFLRPINAMTPRKSLSSSKETVDKTVSRLERLAAKTDFNDRQVAEENLHAGSRQPGRLLAPPERELGARLREIRESKFLTQGELANLTKSLDSEEKGISRAVVSLYEKGTNRPSPTELRMLCEVLRVSPNYLIYGDEDPFNERNEHYRLGTRDRHDPEGYAWLAYVMANIHHNHYEAVMKLVLDLARGWNKNFDQGIQEHANAAFLEKAQQLQALLAARELQAAPPKKK